MKKSLTKLIVSCAAVTAVAAAMAVSASAANVTVDEAKTTITNNLEYVKGSEPSGQATILVQKNTGTAFTEGDIVYIDQQASDGTVPTDWKSIKVAALENGTYVLKMGGTGVTTLASEEFTVGEVTPPAGDKINVLIGDINQDTKTNYKDATLMLKNGVEMEGFLLTGDDLIVGNINKDTGSDGTPKVNYKDATLALKNGVEMEGFLLTEKVQATPKTDNKYDAAN